MSAQYAELLCKTNYSFLRGASHPHELVGQARALGLCALGLTDRGGVYGIPKAFQAAKELPAMKILCGADLPLRDHPSIYLMARNRSAYGLLCRILTEAHRGRPKADPELALENLAQVCGESAASGLIAFAVDSPSTNYDCLKDTFGDRLYFPLSRFLDGRDRERTDRALEVRSRYGVKIVATNDVHYHVKARARLQDVLTSIREGVACDAAGFRLFMNGERYLKSPLVMAHLFRDLPEAISATIEVAESCTFSPAELRYRYPSEWIPTGLTSNSHLEQETYRGARERYPEGIPADVDRQIRQELKLVGELGFADYFITVHDIVSFARSQNILCQGRGSAANSVICYCLGITAVDPVRMNLLFERFISAERGEPPDIDVDFEHERREEVIQWVYAKYGRDRAAMISAVSTYKKRSALREVAKALGVEVGTLSARKVEKYFSDLPGNNEKLRTLIAEITKEIAHFPRHLSIHSGGFTLSADPITEIVPVEPATMPGRTIIQWDKYDLDILGLLKVDLLSLGMLSALRKTLNLVGMKLTDIPADDKPTYDMICQGDTVGTFQIESRAQMGMLPRLKPRKFYDLVIQVAIVRPGPIVGKMIHPYLRRRRGLEPCTFPDPRLETILIRTLGVPLFQEQVMKMAIVLADFTPGEADQLRRAIGAWRSSGSIDKMGQRLMAGFIKNKIPREFAERIFQQIQGFAEYGFPESHAASFALLAYASSYVKCHFPAEFLASMLNSQPLGFYANHTLVDDAKRHGVVVLPLDPNLSDWDARIESKNTVRIGFRVVRGLAKADVKRIIEERKNKSFSDFSDFLARARLNRRVLRALALGDAFRSFGVDQRHSLWSLFSYEVVCQAPRAPQLELFANSGAEEFPPSEIFSSLNEYQAIQSDYASFGLSTRGHPMRFIRKNLQGLPKRTNAAAKALPNNAVVEIAGLAIVMQRPPTAKGTVFATLEDETGFMDLILWKDTFEKYRDLVLDHGFLIVAGKLQKDGDSVSMLVRSIRQFPLAQIEELQTLGESAPRLISEGVLSGSA
jgi:error-prone DNA polymerase